MSDYLNIQVIYALPQQQRLLKLQVAVGTTVAQAIEQSGILALYPQLDLASKDVAVGIYARAVKLTTVLQENDRIEIYRPLLADPKDIRRRRAEKAKAEGRAHPVTGGANTKPVG